MYRWYDTLKDPMRFFVFFIPAATLVIAVYEAPMPFNIVAAVLLLIALVTRAIYIHSGKKGGQ